MPDRLVDVLRKAAEQRPDAAAFTFLGGRPEPYTYGELFARADELADRLSTLDLAHDAPLGLLLQRQEDQVLHYLGALAAGLVPAILTPPNPKLNREYYSQTMAEVIAKSRFAAVISDTDLDLPTALFEPHELRRRNDFRLLHGDGELAAAFLQFSSGTTGIKRGVLISDGAAVAQISAYGAAISVDSRDVIVSWLPLYHDMGFITCLNLPLAFGAHTIMIDPIAWVTRPATFLQAASDYHATLAWNPNFAYAFMAKRVREEDLGDVDLTALRGVVNCSEPVTYRSQEAFRARFTHHGLSPNVFWGCYAMAETTFALTHGTPEDAESVDVVGPKGAARRDFPHVSVGRCLPSVELRVISAEGDELPDREIGELYVRSPFTASGYYNDANATAASFVNGWYRTGDLGYRVGAAFYVVGRNKDVMIVGGVNVFPQDIEELVSEIENVVPGRVTSFSSFDPLVETERVVILFETDLEDRMAREQLVLSVRQRVLAAFQIANFDVHALTPGWLVKSSAGKIARGLNQSKWQADGGQSS